MDDRQIRNREQSAASELTAIGTQRSPRLGPCVVQTAKLATYPTKAASYFYVQEMIVGGLEMEGGPFTLGSNSLPFYAANIGSALPPVGTSLRAEHDETSGRWLIAYYG